MNHWMAMPTVLLPDSIPRVTPEGAMMKERSYSNEGG